MFKDRECDGQKKKGDKGPKKKLEDIKVIIRSSKSQKTGNTKEKA